MSDFSQKGVLRNIKFLSLKCLLVLSFAMFVIAEAQLSHHLLESPLEAPTVSTFTSANANLPLPVTLASARRPYRRQFSPTDSASPMLAPSELKGYGSLTTSGHASSNLVLLSKLSTQKNINSAPNSGVLAPAPSNSGVFPFDSAPPPLSPDVSDCCKPGMVPTQGSQVCHCVYPIRIELLLLNASFSSNWSVSNLSAVLEELASQLGLQVSQIQMNNFYLVGSSGLNMTMDIAPHTGISFSAGDVHAINSSLVRHKVHFNPTLVGDYRLLNLTWFEPPAPSPAPTLSVSPIPAPPHLPSTHAASSTHDSRKHSSLIFILGISSGTLVIIIISVIILSKCQPHRGPENAPATETVKQRSVDVISSNGSLRQLTSTRFLPYEELKEATKDFEPASLLGEGGFGRVFKGVLNDGTPVAIKKLTSGGHQGNKEFLVEVEMLSRLHHRNLVKLVGYYSSHASSQNLLCYELVSNGSLEAWLHGPLGANCPLEWDTRMKIALDAARGLAYLHEDSQPCVIHRDFKASNILLDDDFHAKVADFGLAKQAPEGHANHLSTRVMGTFGYVAPEYAMTGHLLVKSDVYSYGVVLLELLTGRKPVDMTQPSGEENLVTWARPILRDKDRLEELADPRLAGKYPKDDFVRVCTIAAACVAPEPHQRPTMGEVVQSLKMVQRVMEHQDSVLATATRPNIRQSSTTYESDGTSSMLSSGCFSGLSAFDNENISKTPVFSEDLHEGR